MRALCLCLALLFASPLAHAAAQVRAPAADPGSATEAGRGPAAEAERAPDDTRAERPRRAKRGRDSARVGSERATSRAKRAPRRKSAYDLLKETWHEPPDPDLYAQAQAAAVPDLVFRVQGKSAPYALKPTSRQGGFDEAQLALAREAFGSWDKGPLPHPRVLDLIYASTLHFEVPYVYLISGVRKDRGGSRHSHGLAADIVLPGVDDEELAAFFRAQGFVGVGTYPRSGFVHVDTRDKSYFWIDSSSPGSRGRVRQVRAAEAKAVDEAALARGSETFVNPPRLQKALNARAVRRRRARMQREAPSRVVASESSAP